jgi:REP element-mobilizing transposase RayT
MHIQDYCRDEVRFAYCYHAYLRWSIHRRRPYSPLAHLNTEALHQLTEPYGIHTLECVSDSRQVLMLVSLQPRETISACASKVKGQTSKWLAGALRLEAPTQLLARGYFACTSGKSTRTQVEEYLAQQGEHHGYASRPLPPVYVATFDPISEEDTRLQAHHAFTVLHFHLVLATWKRHGVFGPPEAQAVAARWRALEQEGRFALRKVSFVPDHVHVAVRTHPAVAPADLAVILMNAAQQVVWERFAASAIGARVERLWLPSAYVGAYGDLATPQIQKYLTNWQASLGRQG